MFDSFLLFICNALYVNSQTVISEVDLANSNTRYNIGINN